MSTPSTMARKELLQLGRKMYAEMSPEAFLSWAGDLLELAAKTTVAIPEVVAVIAASREPTRWTTGKELFHALRELTLVAESSPAADPVAVGLLYLAENVAKVTFNASADSAQFDLDAADWIPVCVQYIVAQLPNESPQRSALERLLFTPRLHA